MKHKIIPFILSLLMVMACVGCGAKPQKNDSQGQVENLPAVQIPDTAPTFTEPDAKNQSNPATGDGLFAIIQANGTVLEFTDTGCVLTPTHQDGNVAFEAAPGYEDQEESIGVTYDSDCVFQIAYPACCCF